MPSKEATTRSLKVLSLVPARKYISTLLYVHFSWSVALSLNGICFHQVTGLRKTETSGKTKWFITTSPSSSTPIAGYDHVIIAAPIHNSQITIVSSPASFDPVVEYVHLHVTLFSTTSPTFDPVYFGLSEGANVPSMVLTTWDAVRSGRGQGPDFNSIAYHGLVKNDTEGKVWTGKVFSKERKSDEWLSEILGDGQVGWVYRTEVSLKQLSNIRVQADGLFSYSLMHIPRSGLLLRTHRSTPTQACGIRIRSNRECRKLMAKARDN